MWLEIQDRCFPSKRSPLTEAQDHSVNALQCLKLNRETQQQPRRYAPTITTDTHSGCWLWPSSPKGPPWLSSSCSWNRLHPSVRLGLLLSQAFRSFHCFQASSLSLLQFCTFLGLQALCLTSDVAHLPVLPLRSVSSHDTLPASLCAQ